VSATKSGEDQIAHFWWLTPFPSAFANTGGRSGNFSAVNAIGLASRQSATFNSATGFITVVPEPSTCAMALAGLACGGYLVRRRRRAR